MNASNFSDFRLFWTAMLADNIIKFKKTHLFILKSSNSSNRKKVLLFRSSPSSKLLVLRTFFKCYPLSIIVGFSFIVSSIFVNLQFLIFLFCFHLSIVRSGKGIPQADAILSALSLIFHRIIILYYQFFNRCFIFFIPIDYPYTTVSDNPRKIGQFCFV